MNKQRFRQILIANGYERKLQSDLTYDLSPYVFNAQQFVLKELHSNIQNSILDNLDLECEGLSSEFNAGMNYAQKIIRAEFDKFIASLEEHHI